MKPLKSPIFEGGEVNYRAGVAGLSNIFHVGAIATTHKYGGDEKHSRLQCDPETKETAQYAAEHAEDNVLDWIAILSKLLAMAEIEELSESDIYTAAWAIAGMTELAKELRRISEKLTLPCADDQPPEKPPETKNPD